MAQFGGMQGLGSPINYYDQMVPDFRGEALKASQANAMDVNARAKQQEMAQQQKDDVRKQQYYDAIKNAKPEDLPALRRKFPDFAQNIQEEIGVQGKEHALPDGFVLDSSDTQQTPQQQPPTAMDNIEQAARGLVNIPFDIAQGGVNLVNAASQAVGVGNVLDPVYRPIDRPTDPYAQIGESIGNYLVPGAGPVGSAMIGSVANAGNQPGDFAENATKEMLINSALMGAPALYRGAKNIVSDVAGTVRGGTTGSTVGAGINTANDVSGLARSSAGRQEIASQAGNITDDVSKAAQAAGVDVNALTPGMRSGSRGIAQAEGALASTPGGYAECASFSI